MSTGAFRVKQGALRTADMARVQLTRLSVPNFPFEIHNFDFRFAFRIPHCLYAFHVRIDVTS